MTVGLLLFWQRQINQLGSPHYTRMSNVVLYQNSFRPGLKPTFLFRKRANLLMVSDCSLISIVCINQLVCFTFVFNTEQLNKYFSTTLSSQLIMTLSRKHWISRNHNVYMLDNINCCFILPHKTVIIRIVYK